MFYVFLFCLGADASKKFPQFTLDLIINFILPLAQCYFSKPPLAVVVNRCSKAAWELNMAFQCLLEPENTPCEALEKPSVASI
jgi:hypothetical protein